MRAVRNDDGGVIRVPVGARNVEPGARTLLLVKPGISLKRPVTFAWYAEVMAAWECTEGCWTNVRIFKLTIDDGTLVDTDLLVPQARKTEHECAMRLKVRFPRPNGQYEYLHRLVAFAFPPQGVGTHERFGDYAEFSRSKYQADHLVDADLVARPSMAIAGWLDPILPAVHKAREKLRQQMREARDRAEEVQRRLDRGAAALLALEDEERGLLATRRSLKRQRALRDNRCRAKRLKAVVEESRAVEVQAVATTWDIQAPGDLSGLAGWQLGLPDGDVEYGESLLIEFDQAIGFSPHDRKRAALFARCRQSDLLKLRSPLD